MEVNIIIRFAESTIAEITIPDIETQLSHHYPENEPIRESRLAYVTPEMNIKFEISIASTVNSTLASKTF